MNLVGVAAGAGLAVRVSTPTRSTAIDVLPRSALPVLLLLAWLNIDEVDPANERANVRLAESAKVYPLLQLALLAQLSLDYMRNTRLKKRLGQHRARSRARGQDQGQCSPA